MVTPVRVPWAEKSGFVWLGLTSIGERAAFTLRLDTCPFPSSPSLFFFPGNFPGIFYQESGRSGGKVYVVLNLSQQTSQEESARARCEPGEIPSQLFFLVVAPS